MYRACFSPVSYCNDQAWRLKSPGRTATRHPAHLRGADICRGLPHRAERVLRPPERRSQRRRLESRLMNRSASSSMLRIRRWRTDTSRGRFGRQRAEFLGREPAVAPDIGRHFFRRLSGKSSHGVADDGPKGKNAFMNRHHIDDVAGFAPVGGGCFISGEVDGVEHVPKKVHPVGRGRIERRLKARR